MLAKRRAEASAPSSSDFVFQDLDRFGKDLKNEKCMYASKFLLSLSLVRWLSPARLKQPGSSWPATSLKPHVDPYFAYVSCLGSVRHTILS